MVYYKVAIIIGVLLFLSGIVAPEHSDQPCQKIDDKYFCICNSTVRLSFPGTLDLDLIPDNVRALALDSAHRTELRTSPLYRSTYCNVLRNDHQSIPVRSNLTKVILRGFTGQGQRPPFRKFLQNIQDNIEQIYINYCRIGYLEAGLFGTHRKLNILDLSNNDIYDISADAFRHLELTGSGGWLGLNGNALQELDLRVFQPLASWVSRIRLEYQLPKMRKLYASGDHFEFTVLKNLSLNGNDLTGMPLEILQSMPKLQELHLLGNMLCDVDDCSCCEMEPFRQFLANKSSDELMGVTFQCGSMAYNNHELYGFVRLPSSRPSCPKCVYPDPLTIQCQNGIISVPDSNVEHTNALLIRFSSDKTLDCADIVYDLYHTIQSLGNVSQPEPSSSEAALYCRDNRISVWRPNPNVVNPLKVTVDTDLSPHCRNIRAKFLKFLRKEIQDKGHQNTTLSLVPVTLSVETWIASHLVCPLGAPLFINCTEGRMTFSVKPLNTTKSTVLHVRGDESVYCRESITNVSQYLLNDEGTTVEDDAVYSQSQDGVVAVCQHGRIVLSESGVQNWTKMHLTYYSAPNDPCQQKYRAFLNYIQARQQTLA
ncbi:uncharacterized protein LOC129591464 [Paramacrobiotus metropolitanus]|uniref:uncharacterized protein LOC129591464 n=1 Tax=Paramacrobiotus metropolitanus TaxID=2943436 RepID=UPI002445D97B|nr:uncharacterized protein LOC129591464 [Paramacrobiotus metropolitanus]